MKRVSIFLLSLLCSSPILYSSNDLDSIDTEASIIVNKNPMLKDEKEIHQQYKLAKESYISWKEQYYSCEGDYLKAIEYIKPLIPLGYSKAIELDLKLKVKKKHFDENKEVILQAAQRLLELEKQYGFKVSNKDGIIVKTYNSSI